MNRLASGFAAFAALTAAPALASADPAPPKICVYVAGDPDDIARTAARELEQGLATRSDVRLVADEGVRAAMRGESSDLALADLSSERRRLRAESSDALVLFTVSQRYGCALAVEVAARPQGVWTRRYDVIHHAFVDDGGTSPIGATPAAIASLAREVASPEYHFEWGVAANARLVVSPIARLAIAASHPATPVVRANSGPGLIGWIIAGGAAALLVGGFLIAQSVTPGTPVITVTHGIGVSQ